MKQSYRRVFLTLMVGLVAAGIAWGAGHRPAIMIEGINPHLIEEEMMGDMARVTSSLPTVVVGYTVYLEAHADSEVTAASWTLSEVPAASALGTGEWSTDVETELVPDVVGSYLISLVINGDASVTHELWITAGTYVGVGTVGGATASGAECAVCHSSVVPGWESTSHADASAAFVNKDAVYYAERCLGCHSTGWDTTYSTGGIIDRGFVFPSMANSGVTYASNYDSILATQQDQAQVLDVTCEACHGPGSQHMAATDKNQISASYRSEVCAQCHNEPSHHPEPLAWGVSAHANYGDITGSGHASSSGCTRCHTAQGFVNETIRGGAAAEYAEPDPITCAACHDPHDGSAVANLRRGSVAEACTGCHTLRISGHSGVHGSNQGPMLAGTDGMEVPGVEYPSGSHGDISETCVECHMAAPPEGIGNTVVGAHTFAIVGIDTTGGVPDTILNDTGCLECHGTVTREFVELTQAKTTALMDELLALLPKTAAGTPVLFQVDSLTDAESLGSYNWLFVNSDGSYGVHNYRYAEALLKTSIREIEASNAAGELVKVVDVPNDQGRRVRVIWNAFAAEGSGLATVTQYTVWRHDPINDVWVAVGSARATKMWAYGLDVATDADSTAAGAADAMFKVSGSTTDPMVVYWTNELAGHSVDNLKPSVPAKPAYNEDAGLLSWKPAPDPDVRYYAVYKTSYRVAFPSNLGDPLATTIDTALAVEAGYRYGIAAVDYAGNMSGLAVLDVMPNAIDATSLPASTALLGNAPNPFNPSTEINYQLHEDADVADLRVQHHGPDDPDAGQRASACRHAFGPLGRPQ